MKHFLLSVSILLIGACAFAQDNLSYAQKSAQIKKEIWGTTITEFKSTSVPANLSKESAVILAKSYSLQRSSTGKFKFFIIAAGATNHTVKVSTLHERVKINDKVALEEYSTLEYQKILDKTVSLLITNVTNINNTFVGAKIVKPDGKETEVNTSEEVLLRNETKDKKGKLAISGLQVGDILDYYISTAEVSETGKTDTYKDNDNLFLLADEYPVLYYSLDFQFNKKTSVQYIYANGAPHFEESHNEAGDQLLSLKMRNLPKYQSTLWTSPLRQYPYIEIGSSFRNKFVNFVSGGHGNTDDMPRLEASKLAFQTGFTEYPYFANEPEKKLKDFFDGSRALKRAPLDSAMKVLYDEWKFDVFCSYQGDELDNIDDINYRNARSTHAAAEMSMMLTDLDIDHNVILVCSRSSNSIENVYNPEDFAAMIRVNGPTPMYMSFDDVVTHFNEIPARFQGEKAVLFTTKRHNAQKYTFAESEMVLPVVAADKNVQEEKLQVSLLPANMQKLKVARDVKKTGAMRHDDQKLLLPADDIDNGYMQMVKGEDLSKRLSRNPKTRKMADAYSYSFTKAKMTNSKNFIAEAKSQFDQEPEKLENAKIINMALEITSPVFEYSSSFILNNLVKKAGNNYIIDAGKLAGTFYKPEEKDRVRALDVYMPCARTFKYSIAITIPQGFTAKGLEEMNVKKANKTGTFASVATVSGTVLTINVTRTYTNNFEKAANWPLLLEIIDAAADFNAKKILLEKNS